LPPRSTSSPACWPPTRTAACTSLTEGADGVVRTSSLEILDSAGNGRLWQEFHVDATKVNPGITGATLTVVNTASFVYLLDATDEYLYFGADVHDDWDGASDVFVEVNVALDAAETNNDDIEAEIICEYYGEHESITTAYKTQTRSVNHDIGTYSAAGMMHELVFALDFDLASNVIEDHDVLKCRFRLDGTTTVDSVYFVEASIQYRTKLPALEIHDGELPTEG
jgi:hypothetical protein